MTWRGSLVPGTKCCEAEIEQAFLCPMHRTAVRERCLTRVDRPFSRRHAGCAAHIFGAEKSPGSIFFSRTYNPEVEPDLVGGPGSPTEPKCRGLKAEGEETTQARRQRQGQRGCAGNRKKRVRRPRRRGGRVQTPAWVVERAHHTWWGSETRPGVGGGGGAHQSSWPPRKQGRRSRRP